MTHREPIPYVLRRTPELAHVESFVQCGVRLEVCAVVTNLEIARRTLDAMPRAARAPPSVDSPVVFGPAFA